MAVGFVAVVLLPVFLIMRSIRKRNTLTSAPPAPVVLPAAPPAPPGAAPAPVLPPPPAPVPSLWQRLGVWRWVGGIGLLIAAGAIVHFLPVIAPFFGSAGGWVASLGMGVWIGLSVIILLLVLAYFFTWSGVGHGVAVTYKELWRFLRWTLRFVSGLLVAAIMVALGHFAVRYNAWGMAFAGCTVLAIIFFVLGKRMEKWLSLIGIVWIGFLMWNKHAQGVRRYEARIDARSSGQHYNAGDMLKLQEDSRQGIKLWRGTFTGFNNSGHADPAWTSDKTVPEVWDFHSIIRTLSFTIPMEHSREIFVEVKCGPGDTIARGSWEWRPTGGKAALFRDGGRGALCSGNATLAGLIPDPTDGPEVRGTLLKLPYDNYDDKTEVDLPFTFQPSKKLRDYQQQVQDRL